MRIGRSRVGSGPSCTLSASILGLLDDRGFAVLENNADALLLFLAVDLVVYGTVINPVASEVGIVVNVTIVADELRAFRTLIIGVVDPGDGSSIRVGGFAFLVGVAQGEIDQVFGIADVDNALLDFVLRRLINAIEGLGFFLDPVIDRFAASQKYECTNEQ